MAVSALKAIRQHCVLCCNGDTHALTNCEHTTCSLWPYRMGRRPSSIPHRPLRACRTFCVTECQAEVAAQVKGCAGDTWSAGPCPLYNFRMGRNPNITAEAREKMKARASNLKAS